MSYDEHERTKWMISRMDMVYKNLLDGFSSDVKLYETTSDKGISKLKEWRNYALSLIGASITILLGVASLYNFDIWLFTIVLLILAASGLVIFVIFSKLTGVLESIYADLQVMHHGGMNNLLQSQGFITTLVADLSTVDIENVKNYFVFTQLLVSAVMYSISNQLKEVSVKYKIFPDLNKYMEDQSKLYRKNIEEIKYYFQVFDETKFHHPELIKFVNETLKEFKPNE